MENCKKYLLLQEIFTYYCAVILIYYDGLLRWNNTWFKVHVHGLLICVRERTWIDK